MQRPLRTRIPRESAPQLLPSLSSSRTPPPLPHTSSTPDGGQARGLRWRMCSSLPCRPAAASFVPAACITRRKSSDGEPRSVQDRGGGGCGEWGDAGCGIKGRWRAGRRRLQRRGTTTTSGAASESSSASSSLRRTRVHTPPLPSVALRRRAGVASPSPLRLELRRHGMGRQRRTLIESANPVRPGERTQCPPMRQPLQGGGGGLPAPPRSSASSFPCLSSIAAGRLPPPLSAVLQLDSHCRRERDAEHQPHSPPWPSVRRRTTPLHTARCGRLLPRRPLPPLARPHRSREPTAQGATQHCWRSSSFAGHDPLSLLCATLRFCRCRSR